MSALTSRVAFSFFDDVEVEQLPDPSWLINPILPEQGLVVLLGPPGIGKSFVALDWALSIKAGQEWLGHSLMQGNVLYIAAEGSVRIKRKGVDV